MAKTVIALAAFAVATNASAQTPAPLAGVWAVGEPAACEWGGGHVNSYLAPPPGGTAAKFEVGSHGWHVRAQRWLHSGMQNLPTRKVET